MKVEKAIQDLRNGRFVLIHDSDSRENEIDLVLAAEKATPEHVATMRKDGGGLICLAVDHQTAQALGIPYMVNIYDAASQTYPILQKLKAIDLPYDERSAFSITINAKTTFTGIPDIDRAKTIKEFAELVKNPNPEKFAKNFRSPGHVPLLIASKNLMLEREGQTESSVTLAKLAGLTPATVVCEMLGTGKALSKQDAIEYALKNDLNFIEGEEIKKMWEKTK